MATSEEWLTRDEAAKVLGVALATVSDITRNVKKRPADRAEGQVGQLSNLYWRDDVKALLKERIANPRKRKKPSTANQRKIEKANATLTKGGGLRETINTFIDKIKSLDPSITEVSVLLHRTEEFQR